MLISVCLSLGSINSNCAQRYCIVLERFSLDTRKRINTTKTNTFENAFSVDMAYKAPRSAFNVRVHNIKTLTM